MMPNKQTEFLPLASLIEYEAAGYFCSGIVFSPDTENDHFHGCPPYIRMSASDSREEVFFRVPDAVAYYGTKHAGYTMKGRERAVERGRKQLAGELRDLLYIEDKE